MDLFIKYVRDVPCLWNPLHKSYRDMDVKDEAWRIIVKKLKSPYVPDVQTAKGEWKKLRDNHRDSLKRNKAGSSGLNVDRVNTWKYAEQMEFLVPHMKLRKRPFVLLPPNHESDTEENSESSAVNSHIVSLEESYDSEHSRGVDGDAADETTKRRRKEDLISFELLRDNYTYEQHSGAEVEKRDYTKNRHPLDSFFESMCETTKQFPEWLQKKVKRQVFTVISEAEDCLDNTYERPVPSSSNFAYASTSTGITSREKEAVLLKIEKDPL